jgi:hypothetical protein
MFEDRTTGRIVVAQAPNVLLWLVIGSWLAKQVVSADTPIGILFAWIEVVTLGLWGIDELVTGVNPWRRILGAIVFTFVVLHHL